MTMRVGILMFGVALLLCRIGYSQTQSEMNAASEAEYEKADARLNVVYKKLIAQLEAAEKKKLIVAERKWVAYRDKQAKDAADADEGGSIAPMDYSQTCLELTQARIKELEKRLSKR